MYESISEILKDLLQKQSVKQFRSSKLFSLCPLPFFLLVGTTEKSLAPYSSFASARYLCTLIRSFMGPLFTRQNSPSFLSFPSYEEMILNHQMAKKNELTYLQVAFQGIQNQQKNNVRLFH